MKSETFYSQVIENTTDNYKYVNRIAVLNCLVELTLIVKIKIPSNKNNKNHKNKK